jgi:flagellar biosynthetic protein FliR
LLLSALHPHLIAWALILARVAGVAWTAPAWGTVGLGLRFRLILASAVTVLLIPTVEPTITPLSGGPAMLAGALIGEMAIGIGLGLPAALVIAGARQAGELVGVQAGLAPASLLDPEIGDELTPLGHL